MRSRESISRISPCDTDYTDRSLQTIADRKKIEPKYCTNLEQCVRRNEAEGIQCTLLLAKEMADHILGNRSSFYDAVQEERAALLANPLDGQFWVYREGKWQIVQGKENAINDIVNFALTIIDRQPGERRPFTEDGKHQIVLNPSDALYNDMLDFDDIYGEIGKGNPFRG